MLIHRIALLVVVLLAAALANAQAGPSTQATKYMVVAANPHAVEAGLTMLRAGGSAVDGAIAVQAVLGLVEPQSSGIGGGAFMLHYDAESRQVSAYDGRETAPAAATANLFLKADGQAMKFYDAVVGGRSVGAPGVLRMLELAHREHGRLPWGDLFQPAIKLAEKGFAVSPRLHFLIARDKYLAKQKTAAAYFYRPDGKPRAVGDLLTNPAYAATLREIASGGASAFYSGAIAGDIATTVRDSDNPGRLTAADLAGYQAKKRQAVCRPYRIWTVCGMPPPTSGGITVLQILGILENFPASNLKPGSAQAVHLISEASRLAYADRGKYIADADFVAVPMAALLDSGYLRTRARLINQSRTMGKASAGEPPVKKGALTPLAPNADGALPSTTHFTIVDETGNVVSTTSSVENVFGSRQMVRGFLLNNQLTDFSFLPERDGVPVANRIEAGKRPRSSMSPMIVLNKEGKPVLAIGSPGGSRIIAYVAQALVAALDWNMDMQTTVSLPHHVNRNGTLDLEKETSITTLASDMKAMGHDVKIRLLNSGLHGIRLLPDGTLEGGADPRREGIARGD